MRTVRRDVPHRSAPAEGRAGDGRATRRDDVSLLRRRLRDRSARARRPASRGDGRRRSAEPFERRHALREGPLRHGLRACARPHRPSDGPARRRVARDVVGRRARHRGRRARAASREVRRAREREGDERGRVPDPEALPHRDGDEQRRPLHAPLPLAVGGGHARVDGLGRDVELVPGLRRGRLSHDRRRRCLGEPPGHRDPVPSGDGARRPDRRRESQAHRAL